MNSWNIIEKGLSQQAYDPWYMPLALYSEGGMVFRTYFNYFKKEARR